MGQKKVNKANDAFGLRKAKTQNNKNANTFFGKFGGYKIPTEKDIANTNIQKEASSNKSTISESYVIKNNTVK